MAFWSLFFVCASLLAQETTPKIFYLTPKELPKRVYQNQIFEVEFKLTIAVDEFSNLKTIFEPKNGVSVLNPDSSWSRIDLNTFGNRYYFKAKSDQFTLPTMSISAIVQDGVTSEEFFSFDAQISPLRLKKSKLFSGVSGYNLKISKQKVSTIDDDQNAIVFEMEGVGANFEDFRLDGYPKQGSEPVNYNLPKSDMLYYVVVPRNLQLLEFECFDLNRSSYALFRIPNLPYDDKVSTATDLKPKNSTEIFKIALLGFFSLLMLILLLIKRKMIFLYLLIIAVVSSFFVISSKQEGILKANSSLLILPTKNSTPFFAPASDVSVDILGYRDEYVKVETREGKIGWVKKDDVSKR